MVEKAEAVEFLKSKGYDSTEEDAMVMVRAARSEYEEATKNVPALLKSIGYDRSFSIKAVYGKAAKE